MDESVICVSIERRERECAPIRREVCLSLSLFALLRMSGEALQAQEVLGGCSHGIGFYCMPCRVSGCTCIVI